jgi:DNA invertase Pin-like site-specific DNA recombinase
MAELKGVCNMADVPEADTTRVIIAVRVSSDDQKTKGWGHEDQLRMLPVLVAEQGWEQATRPDGSPAIYDEGSVSTTTPLPEDELRLLHRPVLAQLIKELPHTQPTWLVCRKLDRLHRNNLQYEYLTSS